MKKQKMMAQLIGVWALLTGALLLPLQAQAATTAKPTAPSVEQTQKATDPQPVTKDASPGIVGTSININTASAEEIATVLNGVGLKKAQAIVEYREKNGAFTQIEQLEEVKGIGAALIARNRDRLKL
ncbi:ComEA family DNA-binding protein [Hafnia alvei]|uniref:ComEA family DNA-binding protein n=1 Tax=Hafnia TaxID=568 RepID=UPI0006212599|nr:MULTISPECIES: ComEA family DNA-binding protein [Hafnia]KKI42722.1 competence protein ComEA [Hafnia alvei]MDU7479974.1 ComEA family DNA-binding protein [Hafnia alvei]QIP56983.1 ComEA family DNA-binding protein [Hafnia alvei]TBL87796.1 ComEA family DNA-binding protein [Hafnia alvei]